MLALLTRRYGDLDVADTRADLLMRVARTDESATAYRRAIQLTDNSAEIRYLQRRLDAIER